MLTKIVKDGTETGGTLADKINVSFDSVDALELKIGEAVADIATPGTATAEDCANKINELLISLRTAGVLTA